MALHCFRYKKSAVKLWFWAKIGQSGVAQNTGYIQKISGQNLNLLSGNTFSNQAFLNAADWLLYGMLEFGKKWRNLLLKYVPPSVIYSVDLCSLRSIWSTIIISKSIICSLFERFRWKKFVREKFVPKNLKGLVVSTVTSWLFPWSVATTRTSGAVFPDPEGRLEALDAASLIIKAFLGEVKDDLVCSWSLLTLEAADMDKSCGSFISVSKDRTEAVSQVAATVVGDTGRVPGASSG